jgi:hypothetical protein
LGNGQLLAAKADKSAVSAVIGLLYERNPLAIGGLVMAVYINALNRPAFGALAHIGQETLEASPFVTDPNAAPSIVLVLNDCGARTARDHPRPYAIGLGVLPPDRVAMS